LPFLIGHSSQSSSGEKTAAVAWICFLPGAYLARGSQRSGIGVEAPPNRERDQEDRLGAELDAVLLQAALQLGIRLGARSREHAGGPMVFESCRGYQWRTRALAAAISSFPSIVPGGYAGDVEHHAVSPPLTSLNNPVRDPLQQFDLGSADQSAVMPSSAGHANAARSDSIVRLSAITPTLAHRQQARTNA